MLQPPFFTFRFISCTPFKYFFSVRKANIDLLQGRPTEVFRKTVVPQGVSKLECLAEKDLAEVPFLGFTSV